MKRILVLLLVVSISAAVLSIGCGVRSGQLGSEKNPIQVRFMPSPDSDATADSEIITKFLEQFSDYNIDGKISKDYITMIDGLAGKKVDVAFINSLGYMLAREVSGADAVFQLKGEDGSTVYRAAVVANTNSGITNLEDINGKVFGFTDPYSMSGYLMPLALFKEKGIKPKETKFIKGQAALLEAIYNGEIDAGAVYYRAPGPYGRIHDARERLIEKYPDTLEKIKLITVTDPIPNTPIVFRKGLPDDVVKKLTTAFSDLAKSAEGILALEKLYGAAGLAPANEEEFSNINKMLKKLGKDVKEVVPGAVTYYRAHIWENVPEYQ